MANGSFDRSIVADHRNLKFPGKPSIEVLKTCSVVAQHAKGVKIDAVSVNLLAQQLYDACKSGEMSIRNWHSRILHPQERNSQLLEWIFVADTLNFSFWTDSDLPNGKTETSANTRENKIRDKNNGKCFINYEGIPHTGYFALCAALQRTVNGASDPSAPYPLSPAVFKSWSLPDVERLLQSDSATPMPLLKERWQVLLEAGAALDKSFDGQVANLIKAADKSSQKLLQLLLEFFPSYRDIASYQLPDGEVVDVYFLKRAQIFVADVWSAFNGGGFGEFTDIDSVTMFADYRIPQVLAFHKVLNYSSDLLHKLETKTMLTSGEPDEVELRACSIVAVDMIVRQMRQLAVADGMTEQLTINAILVDNFLWDYRREHATKIDAVPYHRIRCIYY